MCAVIINNQIARFYELILYANNISFVSCLQISACAFHLLKVLDARMGSNDSGGHIGLFSCKVLIDPIARLLILFASSFSLGDSLAKVEIFHLFRLFQ